MPSRPLPISFAVANLLRERRRKLELTVREVETLTTKSGGRIPASTLTRIETAEFDPGLLRLKQLLDLYDLPIEDVGRVMDLEARRSTVGAPRPPETLRVRQRRA